MSSTILAATFEVQRNDWSTSRVVTERMNSDLAENEVLLKVDRFALTANNISYCGAGDLLGYWGFFPAEEGWGRIPVMGYGEVVASAHPDVAEGERVWGFFPMSTHLKITAGKVHPNLFVDVSPHRADYAPIYSQFSRANNNPVYQVEREDQDSLLRGLFLTSWLCEDFMFDNNYFGASQYLISSASSKTSIALAFMAKQRGDARVIGITSAANEAFCNSLGCYDEVLTYDAIQTLDNSEAAVFVDMAGNASVTSQLHHHFGDNMKFSSSIGLTHHDKGGATDNLPGAKPEFFFAPSQAAKRTADWGQGEVEKRSGDSFRQFREFCDSWLQVIRGYGADAVESTYSDILQGKANAKQGQILSMW